MYMYAEAHTGCLGSGGLLTGVAEAVPSAPGSSVDLHGSERLNLNSETAGICLESCARKVQEGGLESSGAT